MNLFLIQGDEKSTLFQDELWLSKLCYMASIFDHMNLYIYHFMVKVVTFSMFQEISNP